MKRILEFICNMEWYHAMLLFLLFGAILCAYLATHPSGEWPTYPLRTMTQGEHQ